VLGEWAGALGGAGLLAATFFAWYGDPSSDATVDAWEAFSVVDLVCAAAALFGLSIGIVAWTGLSVSYPVAGSAVSCGAGALAFALILWRLLDPPLAGDVDLEPGIWLGLAASAAIAVGGYLGMQEHTAPARPAA
jgi:hypothetical protein